MPINEIDEAVFALINDGRCRLVSLWTHPSVRELIPQNHYDPSRVVDKSLQRLRKAGRIHFTTAKGWRANDN